MAIKAVIFDCFGVLVLSGRGSLYHDYPHLKEQIYDLERQSDYGMISRDDFNQAVSQMTDLSPQTVEERYWSTSVLNESAIEWVKEVKKAGDYKVGLLSNIGRGWLDDVIPADKRKEMFDAEVLSSEVGAVKPAAEIFELAAQRLGVTPFECVMIDDILANVDGAERVGMQGVLFGTTTQARTELEIQIKSQENA